MSGGCSILPSSSREVESIYEATIGRLTTGQEALYGVNRPRASDSVPEVLGHFPRHVDPEVNPNVDNMPGINVPSYYYGTESSFSEMHEEDSQLDSANVLRSGAPELWLIVKKGSGFTLEEKISAAIRDVADRQKVKEWSEGCGTPLHHKILMLTPSLLRPGDLVYVMEGVPHQVINMGKNICEAVNIGNGLTYIYGNPTSTSVAKEVKLPYRPCPVEGCPVELKKKTSAVEHARSHTGESSRVRCAQCSAVFTRLGNLERHIREVHDVRGEKCPHCGKVIAFRNFKRHLSTHVALPPCSRCGRHFASKAALRTHEHHCK